MNLGVYKESFWGLCLLEARDPPQGVQNLLPFERLCKRIQAQKKMAAEEANTSSSTSPTKSSSSPFPSTAPLRVVSPDEDLLLMLWSDGSLSPSSSLSKKHNASEGNLFFSSSRGREYPFYTSLPSAASDPDDGFASFSSSFPAPLSTSSPLQSRALLHQQWKRCDWCTTLEFSIMPSMKEEAQISLPKFAGGSCSHVASDRSQTTVARGISSNITSFPPPLTAPVRRLRKAVRRVDKEEYLMEGIEQTSNVDMHGENQKKKCVGMIKKKRMNNNNTKIEEGRQEDYPVYGGGGAYVDQPSEVVMKAKGSAQKRGKKKKKNSNNRHWTIRRQRQSDADNEKGMRREVEGRRRRSVTSCISHSDDSPIITRTRSSGGSPSRRCFVLPQPTTSSPPSQDPSLPASPSLRARWQISVPYPTLFSPCSPLDYLPFFLGAELLHRYDAIQHARGLVARHVWIRGPIPGVPVDAVITGTHSPFPLTLPEFWRTNRRAPHEREEEGEEEAEDSVFHQPQHAQEREEGEEVEEGQHTEDQGGQGARGPPETPSSSRHSPLPPPGHVDTLPSLTIIPTPPCAGQPSAISSRRASPTHTTDDRDDRLSSSPSPSPPVPLPGSPAPPPQLHLPSRSSSFQDGQPPSGSTMGGRSTTVSPPPVPIAPTAFSDTLWYSSSSSSFTALPRHYLVSENTRKRFVNSIDYPLSRDGSHPPSAAATQSSPTPLPPLLPSSSCSSPNPTEVMVYVPRPFSPSPIPYVRHASPSLSPSTFSPANQSLQTEGIPPLPVRPRPIPSTSCASIHVFSTRKMTWGSIDGQGSPKEEEFDSPVARGDAGEREGSNLEIVRRSVFLSPPPTTTMAIPNITKKKAPSSYLSHTPPTKPQSSSRWGNQHSMERRTPGTAPLPPEEVSLREPLQHRGERRIAQLSDMRWPSWTPTANRPGVRYGHPRSEIHDANNSSSQYHKERFNDSKALSKAQAFSRSPSISVVVPSSSSPDKRKGEIEQEDNDDDEKMGSMVRIGRRHTRGEWQPAPSGASSPLRSFSRQFCPSVAMDRVFMLSESLDRGSLCCTSDQTEALHLESKSDEVVLRPPCFSSPPSAHCTVKNPRGWIQEMYQNSVARCGTSISDDDKDDVVEQKKLWKGKVMNAEAVSTPQDGLTINKEEVMDSDEVVNHLPSSASHYYQSRDPSCTSFVDWKRETNRECLHPAAQKLMRASAVSRFSDAEMGRKRSSSCGLLLSSSYSLASVHAKSYGGLCHRGRGVSCDRIQAGRSSWNSRFSSLSLSASSLLGWKVIKTGKIEPPHRHHHQYPVPSPAKSFSEPLIPSPLSPVSITFRGPSLHSSASGSQENDVGPDSISPKMATALPHQVQVSERTEVNPEEVVEPQKTKNNNDILVGSDPVGDPLTRATTFSEFCVVKDAITRDATDEEQADPPSSLALPAHEGGAVSSTFVVHAHNSDAENNNDNNNNTSLQNRMMQHGDDFSPCGPSLFISHPPSSHCDISQKSEGEEKKSTSLPSSLVELNAIYHRGVEMKTPILSQSSPVCLTLQGWAPPRLPRCLHIRHRRRCSTAPSDEKKLTDVDEKRTSSTSSSPTLSIDPPSGRLRRKTEERSLVSGRPSETNSLNGHHVYPPPGPRSSSYSALAFSPFSNILVCRPSDGSLHSSTSPARTTIGGTVLRFSSSRLSSSLNVIPSSTHSTMRYRERGFLSVGVAASPLSTTSGTANTSTASARCLCTMECSQITMASPHSISEESVGNTPMAGDSDHEIQPSTKAHSTPISRTFPSNPDPSSPLSFPLHSTPQEEGERNSQTPLSRPTILLSDTSLYYFPHA